MTLIPPSQSPLHPQRTHHHPPPPSSLSACHPHGVTVMLALPLPSVCHVVSVLLCNFLLSFFFFLPSRRSRKECVSCRSAAPCQGVETAHFRRLTQLRSPGGAWRIPRIPDLFFFLPPPIFSLAFFRVAVTPPEGMRQTSQQCASCRRPWPVTRRRRAKQRRTCVPRERDL